MSRAQLTLEASLKPFFGGNEATAHFVAGNYFHSNFKEAVNSEKTPEALCGTVLENIMFARNYNNNSNFEENDIHNQFTDFIIKTALFHREIDRSTLMGSGMMKFHQSYEDAIQLAFNQKLSRVMHESGDKILLDRLGIVIATDTVAPGLRTTFRDLGLTPNSTFYDLIVAHLFMLGKELQNDAIQGDAIRSATVHADRLRGYPSRGDSTTEETVEQYIKRLVGECNTEGALNYTGRGVGYTSNYCLSSFFNVDSDTNAAVATKSILDRIVQTSGGDANKMMNEIIEKIDESFVTCAINFARAIFTKAGGINTLFSNFRKNDKSSIKNTFQKVLDSLDTSGDKDRFEKCLSDIAYDSVKQLMNKNALNEYLLTTDNEQTRQVMENVFNVWDDLNPFARNFYSEHLHVLAKSDTSSKDLADAPSQGWVDLMKDGTYRNNVHMRAGIRLNLMKENGGGEVLFGQTLPWLPLNHVGNVWYTDDKGSVKFFKPQSAATLRQLYICVYRDNDCVFNGKKLNLPKTFADANRVVPNVDFDLNDVKIIHNAIHAKTSEVAKEIEKKIKFSDLFEDLATGIIYQRDNRGLYRLNGEVREYVGEPSPDNCVGTHLNVSNVNGFNNAKCVKIVRKCLIDGDKDSLALCLDELRDNSLFDVAQRELADVDPNIAVKILKTFGVRGKLSNGIQVSESFDSWLVGVVNTWKPDVRNAITGNNNLLDYIKGVIAFVNSHPAIMNENMNNNTPVNVSLDTHPEDVKMGKEPYRVPHPGTKQASLFKGGIMRGFADSIYASQIPTSGYPFTNTLIAPAISGFVGPMAGGNSGRRLEEKLDRRNANGESSREMLIALMASVTSDLKNAGMELKKDDQDRIWNGIEQVKQIEDKIFGLYNMLRSLADLLEFFKATNCEATNFPKEITISQIRDRKDTIAFLGRTVTELQDCVGKNVNIQNSACNDLMKHMGTLFETSAEKM